MADGDVNSSTSSSATPPDSNINANAASPHELLNSVANGSGTPGGEFEYLTGSSPSGFFVSSAVSPEAQPEMEDNEVQLPALKNESAPTKDVSLGQMIRNEIPDSEGFSDEEVSNNRDSGMRESTADGDVQMTEADGKPPAKSLFLTGGSRSELDKSVLDGKAKHRGDGTTPVTNSEDSDSKKVILSRSASEPSTGVAELYHDGTEISTKVQTKLNLVKSASPVINDDIPIAGAPGNEIKNLEKVEIPPLSSSIQNSTPWPISDKGESAVVDSSTTQGNQRHDSSNVPTPEAKDTHQPQLAASSPGIQHSEAPPPSSSRSKDQVVETLDVQADDEVLPDAPGSLAEHASAVQQTGDALPTREPSSTAKGAKTQNSGSAPPTTAPSSALAEERPVTSKESDTPPVLTSKSIKKQDGETPARTNKTAGSSQKISKTPTPNSSFAASSSPQNKDALKAELKAMKIVRPSSLSLFTITREYPHTNNTPRHQSKPAPPPYKQK